MKFPSFLVIKTYLGHLMQNSLPAKDLKPTECGQVRWGFNPARSCFQIPSPLDMVGCGHLLPIPNPFLHNLTSDQGPADSKDITTGEPALPSAAR